MCGLRNTRKLSLPGATLGLVGKGGNGMPCPYICVSGSSDFDGFTHFQCYRVIMGEAAYTHWKLKPWYESEVDLDTAQNLYMELISPIERRMMNTVARIVRDRDDTADVFQEVLAVVWRKLEHIHRHPNPHAYIMRVCVTKSYDALRKRARRRKREVSIEISPEPRTVYSVDRHEIGAAIRSAISVLPPKQGKAILLRLVDGSSYELIGEVLGCSSTGARSHVSKGKARLRLLLTKAGFSC